MAIDGLIAPLRRVALFQHLRPLQITEIARRAERRIFTPGQVIIEDGEEAEAGILIVSGEVERTQGPWVDEAPELLPVGVLLGELAMFVTTEHTSTVVARSMVRALVIPRSLMLELLADDPDMADRFTDEIVSRLADVASDLRGLDAALADLANGGAANGYATIESAGFTPGL